MWAFIRNLSAAKFFSAAKAGNLQGTPPYTFGAIFALETEAGADATIFGDLDPGTDGFGIRIGTPPTNQVRIHDGTILRVSGSDLDDGTAVADADNTAYAANDADLVNKIKGYMDPGDNPGGGGGTTPTHSWPSPRKGQLLYVACSVVGGANVDVFCNGKIVASVAEANVPNAAPVRIGLTPAGADASGTINIAGCFYHPGAMAQNALTDHMVQCQRAKDLVPLVAEAPFIGFVWSVKQARLHDGRTNWASVGTEPSINMALTGTLDAAGANSDLIARDFPWMTV